MAVADYADRVLETTTTTGTGTLTLAGAVAGYRSFSVIGNGNNTPVAVWAVDANGNPTGDWEVYNLGVYTLVGTTLTRGTFLASSTGAAVNFAAGTKRVAQALPAAILQGHTAQSQVTIVGLVPVWVSATAINILIGSAYVQSVDRVVTVAATINLTGLAPGVSVFGYVYLLSTGTAEVSTTAPAAPYAGTARSKSGDTSRRFLVAIKTDSAGNIIRFTYDPASNLLMYRTNTGTTFRVLASGAATTKTTIACAVGVPPTTQVAFARPFNNGPAGVNAFFGSNDDALDTGAINYVALGSAASAWLALPLDASQQAAYLNDAINGLTFMDIYGYYNAR